MARLFLFFGLWCTVAREVLRQAVSVVLLDCKPVFVLVYSRVKTFHEQLYLIVLPTGKIKIQ